MGVFVLESVLVFLTLSCLVFLSLLKFFVQVIVCYFLVAFLEFMAGFPWFQRVGVVCVLRFVVFFVFFLCVLVLVVFAVRVARLVRLVRFLYAS